jgi:hypothetical protein
MKNKTPPRPYCAREGVGMVGVPSIVPVVGCRALIAPVSYFQWLLGSAEGLSIDQWARAVKPDNWRGRSTHIVECR